MSGARPASSPPELHGFEYKELLGSGGFADVFLYRQAMPSREVAVKVLLKERLAQAAESFAAEANLMAQLSSHPAIVSIYEAGVSLDGRPYLVMENCPKPNLQARYRRGPLSVAESLRIGIQVAGAVETAHRAGILHRDIKPANVLVTAYNRPALTDFGIAGAMDAQEALAGMSIPWSPPESFAEPPMSSPATDVYALGATVYTLLAGRSPFEIPGDRNTAAVMIDRIHSTPLPPLGREDAPAALGAVLTKAMAKQPGARYQSALELAHALQRVQAELAMSVTPVDVLDDTVDDAPEDDEDDGRTRVRSVTSIDPSAPPAAQASSSGPWPSSDVPTTVVPDTTVTPRRASRWGAITPPPASPGTSDEVEATVLRGSESRAVVPDTMPAGPAPETVARPRSLDAESGHVGVGAAAAQAEAEGADGADVPVGKRSKVPAIIGAVAAVLLAGGVGASMWLSGGDTADPEPTDTPAPVDVVEIAQVPTPSDVAGTLDGASATFTWSSDDLGDGDTYQWRVVGADAGFADVDEPTVTFDTAAAGGTCIEVRVAGASGRLSEAAQGCAT